MIKQKRYEDLEYLTQRTTTTTIIKMMSRSRFHYDANYQRQKYSSLDVLNNSYNVDLPT